MGITARWPMSPRPAHSWTMISNCPEGSNSATPTSRHYSATLMVNSPPGLTRQMPVSTPGWVNRMASV